MYGGAVTQQPTEDICNVFIKDLCCYTFHTLGSSAEYIYYLKISKHSSSNAVIRKFPFINS